MVQSRRRKAKQDVYKPSLGVFTNFPIIIHGIAKVTFRANVESVQKSVVQALHELNGLTKRYPVSLSSRPGTLNGRVGFEVGVAEGIDFNYLDEAATRRLCEFSASRNPLPFLDFLLIVTYHYTNKGKTIPLNFDYHQLRFIFHSDHFEIHLFHCKGIRRMPLDEVFSRLIDCVSTEMRQRSLKPLIIQELNVL